MSAQNSVEYGELSSKQQTTAILKLAFREIHIHVSSGSKLYQLLCCNLKQNKTKKLNTQQNPHGTYLMEVILLMSFSDWADNLDGSIISTGCRRKTRLSNCRRDALSQKLSKITSPVVGWIACQIKKICTEYLHFQGVFQWLKLLNQKENLCYTAQNSIAPTCLVKVADQSTIW